MYLILISIPIIGALIILGKYGINKNKYSESLGLIISLLVLFLTIIFTFINQSNETYGFIGKYWNIEPNLLNLGTPNMIMECDGLSLVFILLTTIITPISILSANRKSEMISCILLVEGLLIGAFLVLDFCWFYVLFESVLIPMFFLIGSSGSGVLKFRISAAYRLFLYTLAGSVLMLGSLLYLYIEVGSTNWYALASANIDEYKQYILFPLIFIAFAVKIPMLPVHLWLPSAHVEAPTCGSVILAALLLKLGGYGMLRWLLPILPIASFYYAPLIMILSLLGILYGSLTTLRQIDMKRIIAYSSVAHMNMIVYGIFSLKTLAIEGSILQMINHGIVSSGLFLCIGILYERHGTRILKYYRGFATTMPLFSIIFFIFSCANMAIPLTNSFIGEFMILAGSFEIAPLMTILAAIGIILGGGYSIWLYNRICFGTTSIYITKYKDITRKEFYTLLPLIILVFLLGIKPNLVLDFIYI